MNRKQKEEAVAQLRNRLEESRAVFVTDFQGLKVDEMTNLRRKVRDAGGQYEVAKNTLLKLAVKDTAAEQLDEFFLGNNAIGTAPDDPVPLAKALVDFAKEKDKLVIKGGVLAGKTVSYAQIKALADLPPREVLLANLLGTMNAVPGNFVRVLVAVPQKFVYALAAVRDQKEAAGA